LSVKKKVVMYNHPMVQHVGMLRHELTEVCRRYRCDEFTYHTERVIPSSAFRLAQENPWGHNNVYHHTWAKAGFQPPCCAHGMYFMYSRTHNTYFTYILQCAL